MQLEEKVLNTITNNKLINNGDRVVIGVSGGPDSMTLLHVLICLKEKLGIKICVAHINHQIRKEADEETKYVQDFCQKSNIECYVKKVDVIKLAEEQKISTETAGRNIRYEFFEEVLKNTKSNKIATAHTANDNAETVLMNLIRGSGVSGLKGIEKIRDNKFVRPLIECTRQQIEDYCTQKKLNPKYDKTNMENIYTRNRVRNKLIPYIQDQFNPNIVQTLNRLSNIVEQEEKYFVNIVENQYEKLHISGDNNTIVLDLKKFNMLDTVIKSRIILYTINKLFGSTQGIEKIHIEDIIKLCGNNIGNKYITPNKNLKIFVKKGKIYFISIQ